MGPAVAQVRISFNHQRLRKPGSVSPPQARPERAGGEEQQTPPLWLQGAYHRDHLSASAAGRTHRNWTPSLRRSSPSEREDSLRFPAGTPLDRTGNLEWVEERPLDWSSQGTAVLLIQTPICLPPPLPHLLTPLLRPSPSLPHHLTSCLQFLVLLPHLCLLRPTHPPKWTLPVRSGTADIQCLRGENHSVRSSCSPPTFSLSRPSILLG